MQYDDEEQQLLWDQAAQKEAAAETPADTPAELEQKEVIHKIQYGDTLEGLSLEYSVSVRGRRCRSGRSSTATTSRATPSTT